MRLAVVTLEVLLMTASKITEVPYPDMTLLCLGFNPMM
jgi:hypothetical protein